MKTDTNYLFVYGTLMQGFGNNFAMKLQKSAVFEGNGSFSGLLYLVEWYPAAVYLQESESQIYGEIYRLENHEILIRELDEYEDVFEDESASLYVRKIVPVNKENKTVVDCWVYLYNQSIEDLKRIESGNFRDVSL